MVEKDDIEKKDAMRALPKITDFLTVPHGIPKDTPEIVDTQADLSNNAVAEMLVYHRTLADRFKMLGGEMTKGEVIENFANRISLLTWSQNRKSREEAVLFGRGMREEKPRLSIESLEGIEVKPPDNLPRKKRLGLV
ncbi:MAG: hypothetical protein HWN68_10805 [Desulfobacterales bacterium]|nr:hypothetical protein [Desulfobacterales bacterium]